MNSNSEADYLKNYDAGQFARPSVAVDVLIFAIGDKPQANARKLPDKELRLLLMKRSEHPDKGLWALPGGFVGLDESLEEAAYRKMREKTSLQDLYLEQLYTFGEPHRDPRTRVISCAYLALVDAAKVELPGRDFGFELEWFSVACALISENKVDTDDGFIITKEYALILDGSEQLKAQIRFSEILAGNISSRKVELVHVDGIAFDHASMIWSGVERLRNKLEYTPIAFSLMPRLFTLTDLQQVYETILGRELLAANFRRKIGHMVEETVHSRADFQHRPARLFRFNPDGLRSGM